MSHAEIPLPDVFDNFVGWNFGRGAGEKETNPALYVKKVRCGNENFPAFFQYSLKFPDGIGRIFRMFNSLQTDQVIKGVVCIGEGLVQITNVYLQIRDRKKRGLISQQDTSNPIFRSRSAKMPVPVGISKTFPLGSPSINSITLSWVLFIAKETAP